MIIEGTFDRAILHDETINRWQGDGESEKGDLGAWNHGSKCYTYNSLNTNAHWTLGVAPNFSPELWIEGLFFPLVHNREIYLRFLNKDKAFSPRFVYGANCPETFEEMLKMITDEKENQK